MWSFFRYQGVFLQHIAMSSCNKQEIVILQEIYRNETIAHVLSNLFKGFDDESLDSANTLIHSSIEEIKNSNSKEKKENASEILLCLLASISDVPRQMFEGLFDLCQQGYLDKKLLYFALLARSELDKLSSFLDYERPFLRNQENTFQDFKVVQSNIFMELFLITVKKQRHWLLLLLDDLPVLIKEGNLSQVQNILSHPPLQCLWPLLFIRMLENEDDLISLKASAENTIKTEVGEPSIKELAQNVLWYVNVVLWIREKEVSSLTPSLLSIQASSTLNIINTCSNISALDWNTTHNFLIENSLNEGYVSKWEVSLFDAFCACSLAFEYLLTSLQLKHSNARNTNFDRVEILNQIKCIVCQLYPFSVRLRVMQNIFSLLFVRYEDFQEEICSDSEEGEIDNNQSLPCHDGPISVKSYNILSSSLTSIANITNPESREDLLEKETILPSTQSSADAKNLHESYNQKQGFVCDRFMTRDILKLLESCLSGPQDTLEDKMFGEESNLSTNHTSQFSSSDMESKYVSLQNKITTALWKLEILLGADFVQLSNVVDSVKERFNPPNWLIQHCLDDDSTSDEELQTMCTHIVNRKGDTEKSSESGSQSNLNNQGQGLSSKWNRKCRRRSSVRLSARSPTDTIIKRMLSSKQNLVSQCLSRGSFGAAKQAIKTLGLQETVIASEVNFMESYQAIKHKIGLCAHENQRDSMIADIKSPNSTLQAIQRAASAGVQASSLNKEVEKLLLSKQLPSLGDALHISEDFLHLFGGSVEDQPLVAAAVDIALILSTSLRQAANFLNILPNFSHDLQNIQEAVPSRLRSMGYAPLIQNVLQVTGAESSSPSDLFHRWDVPNFVSHFFRDTLNMWDSFTRLVKELGMSQSSSVLYPKFLQLAACYHSSRGLDTTPEFNYLQDFKAYLKLLKVCKDRSTAPPPDTPLTQDHFLLLNRSPLKLLSHMVLEEGMTSTSLELFASLLGFNLPHILSTELCSILDSVPPAYPYINLVPINALCCVKVLNAFDVAGPARHPAKAVEELLQSVYDELIRQLDIIQKLHQSKDGYLKICQLNIKQMQSILAATWELQYIDVKLLQPGAETLAFYCNLANLIWVHCVVYLSSISNMGDLWLKALVGGYNIQQLVAMNSFVYQVGTSGILTLWEIRRLALGVQLMKPAGTESLKDYALSTDSFDPLALFVVSSGSKHSPKLKVISSNNLEKQLQKSVQDYIQYWADIKTDHVAVPSLVHRYIQSTGQNMCMFLKDYVDSSLTNQGSYPVTILPDEESSLIVLSYEPEAIYNTSTVDEPITSWKANPNLCESILQYIKSYSPLVSVLLCELLKDLQCEDTNESDEEAQEATESNAANFHPLQQFPHLEETCKGLNTATLSEFFSSNILLTVLHSTVPHTLIWSRLDLFAREQKWQTIVDLLKALPPLQISSDPMLSVALDLSLLELTFQYRGSEESWLFCKQIRSIYFRARCIFAESTYWPGEVCISQLGYILKSVEIRDYPSIFLKAKILLHSITIYQEMVDCCGKAQWKSWQEVQKDSQINPAFVLEQIILHQNARICVEWLDLINISTNHTYMIDTNMFVLLLNDDQDRLQVAEKLLLSIPTKRAAKICFEALGELCRLHSLQFCVKFLKSNCIDELDACSKEALETVSIGIQMLKSVPITVQNECIELVSSPQLMVEQLIMNVQLEAAEQMLCSVQGHLLKLTAKSPLSIPALDSMLRQYAEKSLEIGISKGSTMSVMSENSIMDSLSSFSGNKDYVMPSVVPSKAEWVPNEQASICMNCHIAAFTMFNRRHHCRRCGRVVCAPCSSHKMLVQGYGTLKVRVCNSCNKICEASTTQTSDQQTTEVSESFVSLPPENMWRLSNVPSLNDTVRGEFSFEHAPSVSLCLSILKLHSESAACPNFLVDSCETILSYLPPQGGMPNPEVDYGFVIDMCRSLVVAAKVKCAQWGYISDEPNCDQRLSKIDLLSLLVSHGCASLIPNETSTHGLRRLQTQLLEAELWELALEVSTKAGMEKIGVWTSWGKSLLRGGQWKEAREKFAHSFPISSRVNKSAPDSPLLIDILQILENTPQLAETDTSQKLEPINAFNNRSARSPAVAILNSLSSLKSISQGKYTEKQVAGTVQPQIYAECCYYLQEYGSHASYLQFLVRHSDFKGAVKHTHSHSVDPQIFFENVYMPCLRRGQITPLHSAITAEDSSLAKWTVYLHGIGAALEKRKLLNTLYEVQQWSKDHVRAAMTCIRFYHLNANSYSDLAANINHLMRAQSHLEGALAVATASVKCNQYANDTVPTEKSSEVMWLQLPPKELDHHLSTIEMQKELTKFLSAYEADGHTIFEAALCFPHVFAEPLAHGLPTLFGNTADRLLLSGLCLFCGKNVEEGYGIVYRIIEGFHLSGDQIYEAVAVALSRSGRLTEISQLLNCIRSSGVTLPSTICDSVVMSCVRELPKQPSASDIDFLARNISNPVVKIQAFITCGQLKSAYLLAVKYERLEDIEKILQEAERMGQSAIKNICLQRLGRM